MARSRAAIYLFHDPEGRVDEYVTVALESLRPFVRHILFVSNGELRAESRSYVESVVDDVLVRENTGFDVGGYRAGLEHMGWSHLADLDELLLVNNTFFAPVSPWAPVFEEAERHPEAAFWGLTEHAELRPHPFLARQRMPRHLQSYFIAVRSRILADPAFSDYWQTMPSINTYRDSIAHHEARFTEHFAALGYDYHVAFPMTSSTAADPSMSEAAALLCAGCPTLKRRLFFHDPLHLRALGVVPSDLIDLAAQKGYSRDVLLSGLTRTTAPGVLVTNAGLVEPLGPAQLLTEESDPARPALRCLVQVRHEGETAIVERLLGALPKGSRVRIMCEGGVAPAVRQVVAGITGIEADLRVVPSLGGQIAALVQEESDLLADPDALVLLAGDLSSPIWQGPASRANFALTQEHLARVIDLFAGHRSLGAVAALSDAEAPEWEELAPLAQDMLRSAGLAVPLEAHSPLSPPGGPILAKAGALCPLVTFATTSLDPVRSRAALELLVLHAVHSTGMHIRLALTEKEIRARVALDRRLADEIRRLVPADAPDPFAHLARHGGGAPGWAAVIRMEITRRAPRVAALLTPAYRAGTATAASLVRKLRHLKQ